MFSPPRRDPHPTAEPTNVSSRAPVQGRADPSVPSPVGPGWPAHKPYPPRHAPLPFPSWPISPCTLLESITSSTPQPQSAKQPARVREAESERAFDFFRRRVSSSKEQQVTVLDGSVPEGGEAAGREPARHQRDPHHRSGEASQLHHLRAGLAPGQPPRRFLARFFGTRSVEAFLTVERKKKQSRFGGVSPILIVCLGFSAASIPLHRASGIVVAGVVMVSNLNIYCSIPRLLLCACCLLLEATSKYVLVAQCCLFWAALGRNNGFVGSLFRDATSRYLLLRA
jgi:hypothetical protein